MNSRYLIITLIGLFLLSDSAKAKTDKYRCIWRDDPSTTITIAWNQVSGSNPKVYYDVVDFGRKSEDYGFSAKPHHSVVAKGLNNYFVRLSNLMPRTTYYFVIKDSEGVSRRLFFTTIPDHPFERLSIIAGGDSRNHRTARSNANRIVAKLRPDVILFGGDMTGGDNSRQWPQWFDDWQLTIAEDGRVTPIVPARGNHEYSNQTLVDLFDAPNENVYYSLAFGGNLLRTYTLNSMMSAAGSQAEWLEKDLSANRDFVWKFAQYHHPIRPHTARKRNREQQRSSWASLFHEYQVNLVVECDGHVVKSTWPVRPSNEPGSDQGFIRDNERGTVYVGEGCWGAPIRENNHDKAWTRASGSFNQFKWVFVDMERIEVRTIKTDNATQVAKVDPYDIFTPPAGLNIWTPPTGPVIYIENKNYIPAPVRRLATAPPTPKIPASINEITNFDLRIDQETVNLNLFAINESKDMRIEIQRSANGEFFKSIDTLFLDGASAEPRQFWVSDRQAALLNTPTMYYRIMHSIGSGKPKYTPIKSVELKSWDAYDELRIDPVAKILRLKYEVIEPEDVSLSIYSDSGREEKIKRFSSQPQGEHTRIINLKDFLPGIYLLWVKFGEKRQVVKRLVVPDIDK